MAARRRTFAVRAGPRRKMLWGSALSTGLITVPPTDTVLAFSFTEAQMDQEVPMTLIRVRGMMILQSDVGQIEETPIGILGIAVVTEPARVAGVASLPFPSADADAGVWQTWLPAIAASYGGTSIQSVAQVEVDVKAQRKITSGEAIVGMFSNTHASHGSKMAVMLRFLFKLH